MDTFILIIDDSVCVRKIVETTLRREGYATMGFADGITALHWLASEKARIPALIILDVTMPKMDGYTVLRALRKRAATARTPVVMLSRHGGLLDRLKGRLAGANAYLTKPFHQQTILEVVREQLTTSVMIPVVIANGTVPPSRITTASRVAVHPVTLQRMEG
jgi:twitching motility two-component system response regulator PilG